MSIVYKAGKNSLITLELLPESVTNESRKDIFDPNFTKYRTNMAKVISIHNITSGDVMDYDVSDYDNSFVYRVGQIVTPEYFDYSLDIVSSGGIHYFKTKEAAINYHNNNNSINYGFDRIECYYHDNGRKAKEFIYKKKRLIEQKYWTPDDRYNPNR